MTYPRARLDFDILYNLIDNWRLMRSKQIKTNLFKGTQRAIEYSDLQTTISMINHVDKHRRIARDCYWAKKQVRFLTIHCQPVRWNGYKGKPVEMVTLKTQIAREYKRLYDDLNNYNVTFERRKEILLTLKIFLKNYDGYAVEELVYLVNQELIFLDRRITASALHNLRNRIISTLFYIYNIYYLFV